MTLKQKVQKVLGVGVTEALVKMRKQTMWFKAFFNGNVNKLVFADERPFKVYHKRDKNVFFGYYDLQQYDSSGTRILAHVVDKNANPKSDTAMIAWIDV